MDKMIENEPPVKKLKQATLSFLKAVPVKEQKVQPIIPSKKRRSSNSLESTTSCIKINKALTPIESPNSKGSKKRKLSQISNEDKTNEVSSSSEAESAPGKNSNGRCCLLDRFVKVLPPDVHQEISSTNEVLDISSEIDGNLEEKTQTDIVSKKDENFIVIDVDSSEGITFSTASAITDVPNVTPSDADSVLKRSDAENEALSQQASEHEHRQCSETISTKDANQSLSTDESDSSEESISQKADVSVVSVENDTESAGNIPFPLEMTSSTPIKSSGKKTLREKKKTPKTPASESSSKKRKVSSSNSVEKEAEKKKRKEEREKEQMEKKKKLEEQKAEKERLKEEKKLLKEAKEREKQELKDKLEKEKLEKERVKEEERKKREEEKLKKEEEKKKKLAVIEAKQEEKRKKEEEKIKEEEEKKKKEEKAKEVFEKFFIKPKETPVKQSPASGIFIPFQLKKDMHLAPIVRRDALSEDKRNTLDQFMDIPESCTKTYLKQLKSGDIKPHKTGRVLRKNPEPVADVEVIHDSEILKKVTHQVKLLQFHTDYRPPYYGTWRKQPKISPRNPWNKDVSVFDYEVDSDEEWEEEEPGESLSCSDGEEEKGEEVEEEEDDGWMVPHGYLSEGEGCSEDEEITPEKLKRQQLAKAKAWEEEMNRKQQVAPLITVGCFFQHSPSATMTGDVRLLYEFRVVVLTPCLPIPTCLFGSSDQEKDKSTPEKTPVASNTKGPRKKSVPDEAMPDLIRLVHGNISGIKRLIREFTAYWLKKYDPTSTSPKSPEDKMNESLTDSVNESINEPVEKKDKEENTGDKTKDDKTKDDKTKEDKTKDDKTKDDDMVISKRQLELTITTIAVREKRDGFNKMCWYVHDSVSKQYNLTDIQLPNSWVYLTAPPKSLQGTPCMKSQDTPKIKSQGTDKVKSKRTPKIKSQGTPSLKSQGTQNIETQGTPTVDTNPAVIIESENTRDKEVAVKQPPKDQRSIKDFARSKEEIAKIKETLPVKASKKAIEESDNKINNSPVVKETTTNLPDSLQPTPKDNKKSGNQRSIIEFAKKANSSQKSSPVIKQEKLKMTCKVSLSTLLEAEITPKHSSSTEEIALDHSKEKCMETNKTATEQSAAEDKNIAEVDSPMEMSTTEDNKDADENIEFILIE